MLGPTQSAHPVVKLSTPPAASPCPHVLVPALHTSALTGGLTRRVKKKKNVLYSSKPTAEQKFAAIAKSSRTVSSRRATALQVCLPPFSPAAAGVVKLHTTPRRSLGIGSGVRTGVARRGMVPNRTVPLLGVVGC